MIPVGLYENKVAGLSKVLDNMGSTPESLVGWLGDDKNRRGVEMAQLKSHGDSSVANPAQPPAASEPGARENRESRARGHGSEV